MTLEARPNQPQNPEGISAQLQERFEQMQAGILERLEPNELIIVASTDREDMEGGSHLAVTKDGLWRAGLGRKQNKPLNKPDEPVRLVEILQRYASIQYSDSFGQLVGIKTPEELLIETIALDEFVKDHPDLFAVSFLKHMESILEQLSREEE